MKRKDEEMRSILNHTIRSGLLMGMLGCGGGGKEPLTSTAGQLPFPVILTSVPSYHAVIGQTWVYNFRIDTEPSGGYVEKRFDIASGTQGVVSDLNKNKITFTPVMGVSTGTPLRIGWLFASNPSATLTQEVFVVVDP
ncbi:MAG: hypothetical protein IPL96_07830 [Holophagaceae bacterium]|nr:hypothetical protein [Holophagaceae bacterium]